MKSAILALSLFVSLFALANPEEHLQNQTCYDLVDAVAAPASIPREVCLESLFIDTDKRVAYVSSPSQSSYFKNIDITSLIRKTEDAFSFTLQKSILIYFAGTCDVTEFVDLMISGEVDYAGDGDVATLNVSVRRTYTPDSCHSDDRETIYQYSLRK